MDMTSERHGDILSARVSGRMDGSNITEFEAAVGGLIEDGDRAVVMDLENLSYISSAGLRAVLLLAKSLQQRNAKLVLCSLSDPIRDVFRVSGFDTILPIHASSADALASFDK